MTYISNETLVYEIINKRHGDFIIYKKKPFVNLRCIQLHTEKYETVSRIKAYNIKRTNVRAVMIFTDLLVNAATFN